MISCSLDMDVDMAGVFLIDESIVHGEMKR